MAALGENRLGPMNAVTNAPIRAKWFGSPDRRNLGWLFRPLFRTQREVIISSNPMNSGRASGNSELSMAWDEKERHFVLDSRCLWGRRIVSKKLCSFQRAPEFGRDGPLEPGHDLARLLCAARTDDQGRDRRMSRDELRGG